MYFGVLYMKVQCLYIAQFYFIGQIMFKIDIFYLDYSMYKVSTDYFEPFVNYIYVYIYIYTGAFLFHSMFYVTIKSN